MSRIPKHTVDRWLNNPDDQDETFSHRPSKMRPPDTFAPRAISPKVSSPPSPKTRSATPWTRIPDPTQDHPNPVPVHGWVEDLDGPAWRQISRVARLPFLFPKGIALMPDAHLGNGVCVGSVLPMRGALVPSAVGVDIGCGMLAVCLDLQASDLPDNLRSTRLALEKAIPLGSGGCHREVSAVHHAPLWRTLESEYARIHAQHPRLFKARTDHHLGTLGAGNHFLEVSLDERSRVWVVLHSGSRGVGAQIGMHFIDRARRRAVNEGVVLPDNNLGWFPEGSEDFESYRTAMLWAQEYAHANRTALLSLALEALRTEWRRPLKIVGEAVNCHHNYVSRERHFDEDLWVTRKGAIRAGLGEWGVVPGSMGTESHIVRGKGLPETYCSCAHGAGRAMSRGEARERFTALDLRRQTAKVECRKDRPLVDEIPSAYKQIARVMALQSDMVEIVHTLRQVVCVKGG